MKSSGKIIGIILVGGGLVLCLTAAIWLGVSAGGGGLTAGGAALGGILTLLVVAPLLGGGLYLYFQGGQ